MEETLKSVKEEPISESKPAKYDPSKAYSWEPGTQFLFTGEEFGVMLNSIRAILNSPEGRIILLADQANKAIENSIARAVEVGIVRENPNVPQKK